MVWIEAPGGTDVRVRPRPPRQPRVAHRLPTPRATGGGGRARGQSVENAKLQPIFARLPGAVGEAVLAGSGAHLGDAVVDRVGEAEQAGFDMDAALGEDATMPERPASPLTMDYLDGVIATPHLMPSGVRVRRL